MYSGNSSKGPQTIEGLVITVFEDDGPANIYNSSPLAEDEAFNMALKSMTVIGSDVPLQQFEIRSYGPIPTPRADLLSIGYIFNLKATDTVDERIARFGRLVVFWTITRSNTTVKYIGVTKRLIKRIFQVNSREMTCNANSIETIIFIGMRDITIHTLIMLSISPINSVVINIL